MLILALWFSTAQVARACTASTASPSVTICTPSEQSAVVTPAHVIALSTDTHTVTAMQIYVDGKLAYQANQASLNAYVPLSPGNHSLQVKAWDNTGANFSKTIHLAMEPPCTLNSTNRTLTICTPGSGATVSLPIHLVAAVHDSTPTQYMQVWVDGQKLSQVSSNLLDVYLTNLAAGQHALKIAAQDTSSNSFSSSMSLIVTDHSGISKLRHIIFLVQENRSFDSYLGRLGQYRANKGYSNNVDGTPLTATLYANNGGAVHPFHYQTVCTEGLTPSWNESHVDVNGGLMNKFLQTGIPSNIDPYNTRALGYYDWTDLPYLYALAFNFATSDRFFSAVQSNTLPNRMYLFAGTSFGHVYPDTPPTGGWTQPTLFDHLDLAGVSWRYYYQDNSTYLTQWSTYSRDASKVVPISRYYTDLQNESTLPSVIFIERASATGLDEHPGQNIQKGAADVAKMINALLHSPSWGSSAFILAFDEGGGLYDHVLPELEMKPDNIAPLTHRGDLPGDFAHSGFRVPLVVISPWTKPHYVSHTWRDFTSILRLIEARFHVPSLTARDASADDMMEFFNFSSAAWATPPSLPAQPTTGACNWNLEKAPGY